MDVEHKKRGRPPLKAEESQTRRPFGSALSPQHGSLAAFGRLPATEILGYSQQQQARDLRPLTSGSTGDMGRPVYPRAAPSYQMMYAQPTVSPSHATATGTMSRPLYTELPRTSQPQYPYPMGQPAVTGTMGSDTSGRYASSYQYLSSSEQAPGQSSRHFSLFPRTASQPQPMVQASSRASYGQMQGMPSDLRLPPIQPAPPGGSIDPAIAQQQRQAQQQQQQSRTEHLGGSGNDTRQPDPKRPKISDILRND